MTNGKITDEELDAILSYYAYANSFFGKKNIDKSESERIFNTFSALNELKELRKKNKILEFEKNAKNKTI